MCYTWTLCVVGSRMTDRTGGTVVSKWSVSGQ